MITNSNLIEKSISIIKPIKIQTNNEFDDVFSMNELNSTSSNLTSQNNTITSSMNTNIEQNTNIAQQNTISGQRNTMFDENNDKSESDGNEQDHLDRKQFLLYLFNIIL